MIVLDAATKSLRIVLAGAVTTSELQYTASYADYDAAAPAFTPGASDGTTTGTTPVTFVQGPAVGAQRQVKRISVYNADTAQATVTIQLNNGGTLRTLLSVTIHTGERIEYEDAEGFRVFTVAGAVKVTAVQSTVEPGYIDGLEMTWDSATQLTISSGTCYIPSVGANVNFPSSMTKTPTLSASAFHHVYAFLNSGVPDIEVSTTAPSSPYNGSARTKSGDTTRRYIGSVRTNSGSNILQFVHAASIGKISYLGVDNSSKNVLSNGTATAATTISCAALVPVTGTHVDFLLSNVSDKTCVTSNSTAALPLGAGAGNQYFGYANATNDAFVSNHPVNASQAINYRLLTAPTSGGAFIDVLGYNYKR